MGTVALTRPAHWLLHDSLLDDLNRQAPESPFAFRKSYLRMETRKRGGGIVPIVQHIVPISAGLNCRVSMP